MHILALTWDVTRPGDLDPRLLGLAQAVHDAGSSCEVVTLGAGPTSTRTVDGVDVTWVAEAPPVLPDTPDYDLAHVLAVSTRTSAAAERRAQGRPPDVVLAAGWQTAWTATTVRASRGVPIVARLDSTAPDRAPTGELDDTGRLVAQVEWWLTYEARRVVTASDHTARRLRSLYRLPGRKVDVVAHGADPVAVAPPTAEHEPVVVVGPPPVVAALGRGLPVPVTTDPTAARAGGVVVVLDDHRDDVVLAAMAGGAAVVVPDDGPLRGLVHARRSGLRVGRDPGEVTGVVADLLGAPARRHRLGDRARARVAARHAWADVAARHLDVAGHARAEEAALVTSTTPPRPLRPILLRSPLMDVATPANGRHVSEVEG